MVILANASTVSSFNPHIQSVLIFPMKEKNYSNWELVKGKMSNDSINPVRFLHVVCDFGFERRILLHISWGLMLDGFVKVIACFRNLIYSLLYSCTSLEKLALSNGTAILPAAFSIACNYLENMCLGMVLTTLEHLQSWTKYFETKSSRNLFGFPPSHLLNVAKNKNWTQLLKGYLNIELRGGGGEKI